MVRETQLMLYFSAAISPFNFHWPLASQEHHLEFHGRSLSHADFGIEWLFFHGVLVFECLRIRWLDQRQKPRVWFGNSKTVLSIGSNIKASFN